MTEQDNTYQPPSLDKAWAYFREETLPHRVKDDSPKGAEVSAVATGYRKAEPGEGGELYHPLKSSVKDLSEFGLGIGLYFSTLLGLFFVVIAGGLCAAPTISYFKSDDYNPDQESIVNTWLHGSAICSGSSVTEVTLDGETYEKHNCPISNMQLGSDIALLVILTVFATWTGRAQSQVIEAIDESQQTAQDYSVCVEDPDDDATDVHEWQSFFSRWGEVVYVTIALNNGPLLKALAKGRVIAKMIRFEDARGSAQGAKEGEEDTLVASSLPDWKIKMQKFGFFRDLQYWQAQQEANKALINELRTEHYVPAKVFCIFNTEEAQRKCLEDLCEGIVPAATNIGGSVSQENYFRGTNLLMVSEPVEPSEVMYQNLGMSLKFRVTQLAVTAFLTGVILLLAFFAIEAASASGGAAGAITVSGVNVALPIILKTITMLETHVDAGDQQNSMLNKLVVARMLNTAVLIYLLTDFEETLTEAAIGQINSILIADAFTAPALRMFNVAGYAKQFIVARFAVTQEKMNSYFEGTPWNLAERYTDMSKTLFVSLFYSSLLPSGLFITALSFVTSYWVDKWCLFRQWKVPAMLDGSLAEANRSHIIFAIYVHLVMTARFWAGWPFDYVCQDDEGNDYYCDRDSHRSLFFPRGQDYMGDTQNTMVEIYGFTTLIMTIVLGGIWVWSTARYSFRALFVGQYDPVGDPQGIEYTTVDNISAYIPTMQVPGLAKPILCCDLSTVNPEHIEWTGDHAAACVLTDHDFTAEEKAALFSPCHCYHFGGATVEGIELEVQSS